MGKCAAELFGTFLVIRGAMDKRAPQGFAPLAGAIIYRFVAGRET